MKALILIALASTFLETKTIFCKAVHAPLDIITLDDLTPEDRRQLELLNQEATRSKRSGSGSGSGDILATITAAIGQTIMKKIGQIAKSSASASARFSSGSSGHYEHAPEHEHPPEVPEHKSFDWWSLKKSILNTLLQAVKAIKGGVIAVKGQLVKGGGKLLSAKGRLLSAKGEAISNFGKHIASSAVLIPHPGLTGHSGPSAHAEYHSPPVSHYGPPPSSPASGYGAPSAPSSSYVSAYHNSAPANIELPHHGHSEFDDPVAHGSSHAAGLLILKKIPGGKEQDTHVAEESKIPEFKPLEPQESEYTIGNVLGKFVSASSSLQPDEPKLFGAQAQSDHVPYESRPVKVTKHPDNPLEVGYPKPAIDGFLHLSNQKIKPVVEVLHSAPASDYKFNTDSSLANPQSYLSALSLDSDLKLPDGVTMDDLPNIESFGPFPGHFPSDINSQLLQFGPHPESYETKPPGHSFGNYLDPRFLSIKPKPNRPSKFHAVDSYGSPVSLENYDALPAPSTKVRKTKVRHRVRAASNRPKHPQNYNLVKSVAYELGPNGPVKL